MSIEKFDSLIDDNNLKYLEPNAHLKIPLTIIWFLGTWPPFKSRQRTLYLIYSSATFIFILGIYLIVQAVNLLVIWGDIGRMVASAFLLMTNTVHAYKVFVFIRHQKRIQALLDVMSGPTFSRDNKRYERLLTWYAWQGRYHHLAYQSFGTLAVICWGFTPIADSIAGLDRRLPMDAWYPYDTKQTPAYEVTCAHQAVAVTIACFHNVAMDTIIAGLINVACCQLEIIKRNIQLLDDDDDDEFIEDRYQWVQAELNRCIWHSNLVMTFVEEIKSIFGIVVLLQLLVNCLIICLSAYHVTQMTVPVPAELFGMMMYLLCMTYQIFIYCYHGNELAIQSQSIASAAFEGNWWKFNKNFKKSLGIFITRSHKPILFTAGPFMTLSLPMFLSSIVYRGVLSLKEKPGNLKANT
uniref:Odorant receptor n=1 Tax=Aulacocentrum confusum TaxID=2767324 RepID=A0A7G8Z933_9HYME|nr:olfactory receptor 14 [Aulacocentrum confusum]